MKKFLSAILLCVLGWHAAVSAAPQFCPDGVATQTKQPLKVGIQYAPPFVMNDKNGWQGLSIELWETIALCMGVKHEYVEFATTEELLNAVTSRKIDLAIGALSITSKREQVLDFSHSYHTGSIGAIVPDASTNRKFIDVLKRFFRLNVMLVIVGLICVTIFIAFWYWRHESQYGNKFFADGPLKGFYNSVIWAIQLVFAGRGDPFSIRDRRGQLFVLFLTFFGATIVSGITAIITSSLTLQGIEWHVQNTDDLKKLNIGVMDTGHAREWAIDEKLYVKQMRSWPEVQRRLDEKSINAFVHDRDILQFLLKDQYLKNVRLEPVSFKPDNYGIAMPAGSPLREAINRSILAIEEDKFWAVLKGKYLGTK